MTTMPDFSGFGTDATLLGILTLVVLALASWRYTEGRWW